jgi:hypothetical protein
VQIPVENQKLPENESHVTVVINFFDEVRRRVAGQAK